MELNVTVILVILNVAASFASWNNPMILSNWALRPFEMKSGRDLHRIITSGFIHSPQLPFGYMHLGFNMFALYSFGSGVEKMFEYFFEREGMIYYVIFYFTALIVSSLPALIKHRNNPAYSAVGASGAVSAIVFCSIVFDPTGFLHILIPIVGFNKLLIGLAYLVYSYIKAKQANDNVGHEAHFFGALYGIAFTIVVIPESIDIFVYAVTHWDFSIVNFR